MSTLKDQSSRLIADLEDIDKAIAAHRDQIEKLTLRRNEVLRELKETNPAPERSGIVDIQDLIGDYKEYNPSVRSSELKDYLLKTL